MVALVRDSRSGKREMSAARLVIFGRGQNRVKRILMGLAVHLAMELDGSILRIASEGGLVLGLMMDSSPVLQSRGARAAISSSLLTCSQGRSRSPLILK